MSVAVHRHHRGRSAVPPVKRTSNLVRAGMVVGAGSESYRTLRFSPGCRPAVAPPAQARALAEQARWSRLARCPRLAA